MVHLASSRGIHRRPVAEEVAQQAGVGSGSKRPVKLEIGLEDEPEEENAPLNKRWKQHSLSDQWMAGNGILPAAPPQYNPLDEPSPLGLRLKKSPSLLELIQMKLSQGSTSAAGSASSGENLNSKEGATRGGSAATGSNDKLKASNFSASLLRIGHWEYVSRYEGDLVAKCYFAKHKLVWEILEGGLKSKIEIQWSDIMGLNAKLPEEGPASLTLVLARQPLFFRETNPQPRKHTLWQAASDFTDGQASMNRQHFLQFPPGVLNKHFEKLIQCDMRLNYLSHQPEMVVDSPYFESLLPALDHSKNSQTHNLDQRVEVNSASFPGGAAPSASQTSSVKTEKEDLSRSETYSHEAPSPSSGCLSSDAETMAGSKNWEHLIMQGLRPSMSMTDLVNHIGNCISGQGSTENPSFSEQGSESHRILEDIAQHLLGDSQLTCSDEKSLMTRVNSLCSLLQKDGTPVQHNTGKGFGGSEDLKDDYEKPSAAGSEGESVEVSGCKPGMSRKDSYGDLLLNLPRIASLPKFLFDISEDGDNQAR